MKIGADSKPEERTVGGNSTRRSLFTYGSSRRIPTRNGYEAVFSGGEKLAGRRLVAWILPTRNEEFRLGPIAAKRTFRHAVERNRARRLMREAFRLLRPSFCGGSWDLVLVGRKGLLTATSTEVLQDLRRILARRSLITDGEAGNASGKGGNGLEPREGAKRCE